MFHLSFHYAVFLHLPETFPIEDRSRPQAGQSHSATLILCVQTVYWHLLDGIIITIIIIQNQPSLIQHTDVENVNLRGDESVYVRNSVKCQFYLLLDVSGNNTFSSSNLNKPLLILYPVIVQSLGLADLICQWCQSKSPSQRLVVVCRQNICSY